MTLQLIMLGTGNAFAKKYYNNNSIWRTDHFTLLVDCGITAPWSLYKLGLSMDELDGVLITHLHGDHVGGLEELAFQFTYRFRRKPKLFISQELVEPLWEHCLKAGMEDEHHRSLDDYFQVHELEEGIPHQIADHLEVEIIRTDHIPGKISYSLLINRDIFYSADMRFDPELLRRLIDERGVRLIFHDCQLRGPGTVHATLDELLSLPAKIQQKIILMHYDDDMEAYIGKTGPMPFIKQHQLYHINDEGLFEVNEAEGKA